MQQQLVYRISNLIINYLSLILILLLSLVLVVLAIVYSYFKIVSMRKKVRKVVTDAEHVLHRRFDQLETDLVNHLDKLESIRNKRELTKEEKAIVETFREYIHKTERDVDTKLEQLKEDTE